MNYLQQNLQGYFTPQILEEESPDTKRQLPQIESIFVR